MAGRTLGNNVTHLRVAGTVSQLVVAFSMTALTLLSSGCATTPTSPLEGARDFSTYAQRATTPVPGSVIPPGTVITPTTPDVTALNTALYDLTAREGDYQKIYAVDLRDAEKSVVVKQNGNDFEMTTLHGASYYKLNYTLDQNGKLNFRDGEEITPSKPGFFARTFLLLEYPEQNAKRRSISADPYTRYRENAPDTTWADGEMARVLNTLRTGRTHRETAPVTTAITRIAADGTVYSQIRNGKNFSKTTTISTRDTTTVVTTFPGLTLPNIVTENLPNEPLRGTNAYTNESWPQSDFFQLVDRAFSTSEWREFLGKMNRALEGTGLGFKERQGRMFAFCAGLLNYHFNQSAQARELGRNVYNNPDAFPSFFVDNWYPDTYIDPATVNDPKGPRYLRGYNNVAVPLNFYTCLGMMDKLRMPIYKTTDVKKPENSAATKQPTQPKKAYQRGKSRHLKNG